MKLSISFKDYLGTYQNRRKFIHYQDILSLKKKGASLKSIEDKYLSKIPKSTLYFWYNGKRIPQAYQSFIEAKTKFLEEDIEHLAPIIGNLLGDGGISKEGYTHYCNTEDILIRYFKERMLVVFPNEKPCITKYKNATHLIYSPRVGRALWCLFGKFSYGTDTKNITTEIMQRSLNWKKQLLTAIYDDEGSSVKLRSGGYVSFKQKPKGIALFVQSVLAEYNIKSLLTDDNGKWMLRICSYRDMLKFKENVNFSEGYRKREKLDEILNSYKHPQFQTKEQILQILKQCPKTYREIAKETGLNSHVIYGHLHGWKKSGKKDGLIKMGYVLKTKEGIYTLS